MRKTKIAAKILIAALLCVFGLLLLIAQLPGSPPDVTVTLIGYTNDASGGRLAQFAVSNFNTSAVQVYLPFIVTQEKGAWSSGYQPPRQFFFTSIIRSSKSQIWYCPPPTNQLQWKLSFLCYPNIGVTRAIQNVAVASSLLIHVKPHNHTMPYFIKSDWITPEGVIETNHANL